MGKLEDMILEELEKEAKDWIGKEYRRRQEIVRKEIEKQVSYAQEHDGSQGASAVRAYHERAMAYAMSELRNEVEFEADQWIIEEMGKRVKAAEKKGAGKSKAKAKAGDKAKKRSKTKS